MQPLPFDTADVCNYLGSVARGPASGAIFQRGRIFAAAASLEWKHPARGGGGGGGGGD